MSTTPNPPLEATPTETLTARQGYSQVLKSLWHPRALVVLPGLAVGLVWGWNAGLSALVITLVLVFLVRNLTDRAVWAHWRVFVRHLRWSDLGLVPGLVFLVAAAVTGLLALGNHVPALHFLTWGWWSMLGGQGNVITGQTSSGPSWLALAPVLILPLFALNIPRLAYQEEEQYRKGSEHQSWGKRLRVALFFGLGHLIMGIPVGAALALPVAGLGFLFVYLTSLRRTQDVTVATERAGTFHAAYNLVFATLLALILSAALATH